MGHQILRPLFVSLCIRVFRRPSILVCLMLCCVSCHFHVRVLFRMSFVLPVYPANVGYDNQSYLLLATLNIHADFWVIIPNSLPPCGVAVPGQRRSRYQKMQV